MLGAAKSILLGGLLGLPLAAAAFPVNEKKAPESLEDMMMIEKAVKVALPQAKAATVCVDIGEGQEVVL